MEETRLATALERLTSTCEVISEKLEDHEDRLRDVEKFKWQGVAICTAIVAIVLPVVVAWVGK